MEMGEGTHSVSRREAKRSEGNRFGAKAGVKKKDAKTELWEKL